ncbi:BT4734/BF3469 family protein [Pontibacter vulgaris]|uniref:BT4734/BF3469 family protein n=1 Tax=Pontibacter vulgaris TaxID=2905679 RepID=UPI001FA816B0|nr:BT4734/BF3469 family protein [Pontibacter vulgaris]
MTLYRNSGKVSHLFVHKYRNDEAQQNSTITNSTTCDTYRKHKVINLGAHAVTNIYYSLTNGLLSTKPYIPTVSLYSRVKGKSSRKITIIQFLEDIKTGTGTSNKTLIQRIREEKNKETAKALKESMPAITPSAIFRGRRTKGNIECHTGIFNVDIDVKHNTAFFEDERNVQGLLNKIKLQPFWLASWRTVSHGISVLYKIVPEDHDLAFNSFKKDFAELGVRIDNCKDITRLRITSYDQDLEYNSLLKQNFDKIQTYKPCNQKNDNSSGVLELQLEVASSEDLETTPAQIGEDAISYALRIAQKRGKRFEAGTRHSYILSVGGLLNKFGVQLETALHNLDSRINLHQFEEHRRTLIDVYERLKSDFGSSPYRGRQYLADYISPVLKQLEQPSTYVPGIEGNIIFIDNYLSEISIPNTELLILEAPTNCGKTTYFVKVASGRRIMLVPTIALAIQVEKEHGIKAVYSGVQVYKHDEVLVGTYECINKLIKILNISKYELWIDEAHNMVQSSSVSYRNKALSEICENIDYFKRVVLMSGTWIPTSTAPFSNFERVVIKSRNKKLGQFNIIPTDDAIQSTAERIKNNPNTLHLVYLNKKDKSESVARLFTELGHGEFIPIHADKKNDRVQKNITLTGHLPDGVRGIVVTDLFKEGISLIDKSDFCVHLISSTDSITTEQIINRVRKSVPVTFCYLNSEGNYSFEEMNNEQRLQMEQLLHTKAQKLAVAFEGARTNLIAEGLDIESIQFNSMVANKFVGGDDELINIPSSKEQKVTVNNLAVANKAFQEWKKVEIQNPAFYISNISNYGYDVALAPTEHFSKDITADKLKEDRKTANDERDEQLKTTLELLSQEGFDYAQEITLTKRGTPFKLELAARYLFLHELCIDEKKIPFILEQYSSTKAWNNFRLQLLIQYYIENNASQSLVPTSFIDVFISHFEVGKKYSSLEILELVKRIHSKINGRKSQASNLTLVKAVQQVKKFLLLKRDREGKYTIIKKGALEYELKQALETDKYGYRIVENEPRTSTGYKHSTIDIKDEIYRLIMDTDFSE